jgi:hypothetical protein
MPIDPLLSDLESKKVGDVDPLLSDLPSKVSPDDEIDPLLADLTVKIAPGEDVSWWNKKQVDFANLMQMKRPDEMSDKDWAVMKQSTSDIGENLYWGGLSGGMMYPSIASKVASVGKFSPERTKQISEMDDGSARLLYGGMYAATEQLSGLTTPLNLALMIGTGGIGKGLQIGLKKGVPLAAKAVPWAKLSTGLMQVFFAANMGKEVPAQFAGLKESIEEAKINPEKWGDVGQNLVNTLVYGTFAAAAAKGGLRDIGGAKTARTEMKYQLSQKKLQDAIQAKEMVTEKGKVIAPEVVVDQAKVDVVREINSNAAINKTRIDSDIQDAVTVIKGKYSKPIPEMNITELRKSASKNPDDALALKKVIELKREANNIKTEQLDVIASKLGVPKEEVSGYKVPYDGKYDLKYSKTDGKFELVEAKYANSDVAFQIKLAKEKVHESGVPFDLESTLDVVTNGGTKRLSVSEARLINKRLTQAHKYTTKSEFENLLANGDVPPVAYDGKIDMLTGWDKTKLEWGMRTWPLLDKLGTFGAQAKRAMLESHRMGDIAAQNMNSRVQKAIDGFKGNKEHAREFVTEWMRGDKENMVSMSDEDMLIMTQIKRNMIDPIKNMSIEHDLQIMDPRDNSTVSFKDAVGDKEYHLPHEWSYKFTKAMKGKNARQKMIDNFINEQGMTEAKAKVTVNNILSHKLSGHKEGNLEIKRVTDAEGWLADPRNPNFSIKELREMCTKYIYSSTRRIMDRRYFESKGGETFNLSTEIDRITDKELRTVVRESINKFRGIDDYDALAPTWVQHAMNIEIVRKLGLSTILNSTQLAIGALPVHARHGFVATVKDFSNVLHGMYKDGAFRKNGLKDMTADMGEALEETLNIYGQSWSSAAARKVLQMNAFGMTERFNRVFGERLGYKYAQRCMDYYHGTGSSKTLNEYYTNNPVARRELKEDLLDLGVSGESIEAGAWKEVKVNKYVQTEQQLAGARFARRTQFRTTSADVPVQWRNKYLRLMFQFKSFSFNQAVLVNKHFIKPFIANPTMVNAKPLLAWIGGITVSQGTAMYLRNWVYARLSGDTSKYQDITAKRFMTNMACETPLFLAADMVNSASYGGLAKTAAGPFMGDVYNLIESTVQGKPEKVAKELIPTPFDKMME